MHDSALENRLRVAFRTEAEHLPLTVTIADVERRLRARRREREHTRAWATAVAAVLVVAVGAGAFLFSGRGPAPFVGEASPSPPTPSSPSFSAEPSPSESADPSTSPAVSPTPTASPLPSPSATGTPSAVTPTTASLPARIAAYPGWTERASLAREATADPSEQVLPFNLSEEESTLISAVCTGSGVIDLAIDEVNTWTVECPRVEDPRRLVSFYFPERGPQTLRLSVPGNVAFRVLVEVTSAPWPELFLSDDDERLVLEGSCADVAFSFGVVGSDQCGIDLTGREGIRWDRGSSAEITATGVASWRITSGMADCGRVPTEFGTLMTPDPSCDVTAMLVDGVMRIDRIDAAPGRWMLHAELTTTNEVGDWIHDHYYAELIVP